VPPSVNQTRARAERDVIGGNKVDIDNVYISSAAPVGIVETLMAKLQQEIKDSPESCEFIDKLLRYQSGRSHGGIVGLEAKLKAAGRYSEYDDALERKEMFVKLLDQWSLYSSAQQIFVYLLARAEHYFVYHIQPQLKELSQIQVNTLTTEFVIEPTVNDCGSTVFEIDHNVAMGMVYWLAEKCFVRWHP
jgi:hypothetical protein